MYGDITGFRVYLEVVWAHEQVSNALAHDTHDPLIKVLGLALGRGVGHLGLYQPSQTVDLQHTQTASRPPAQVSPPTIASGSSVLCSMTAGCRQTWLGQTRTQQSAQVQQVGSEKQSTNFAKSTTSFRKGSVS